MNKKVKPAPQYQSFWGPFVPKNKITAKKVKVMSTSIRSDATVIITAPPKPEYCLQVQLLFHDGSGLTWGGDTWWTEDEISKAWARLHWHVKNNYPVGGISVRLVRYSIEELSDG